MIAYFNGFRVSCGAVQKTSFTGICIQFYIYFIAAQNGVSHAHSILYILYKYTSRRD